MATEASACSSERILQTLQGLCGCNYLSDLRHSLTAYELLDAVNRLQDKDFSIFEWNDAFVYLTRCGRSIPVTASPKGALMQQLIDEAIEDMHAFAQRAASSDTVNIGGTCG